MAVDDLQGGRLQEADLGQDVEAPGGVLLHDVPLVAGERAGLAQDAVGDRHLADVVEQRAPLDRLPLVRRLAQRARQGQRVERHPEGVAGGLVVPRVGGGDHRADRLDVGALARPLRLFERHQQRAEGLLDEAHVAVAARAAEAALETAGPGHLRHGLGHAPQRHRDALHRQPGRQRREQRGAQPGEQHLFEARLEAAPQQRDDRQQARQRHHRR